MTLVERDGRDAGPRSIAPDQAEGLRRSFFASFTNPVIASVVAAVLWDTMPRAFLIGWVGAVALIVALRWAAMLADRGGATPAARRLLAHAVGATASGAAWGILPLAALGSVSPTEHYLFGFVIAGMSAGAVPSLAWYFPAYLGYLLTATLPLAVAYFLLGGATFNALGLCAALYALVVSATAWRYNATITETLRLRRDVSELARSLTATRGDLARADERKWRTLAHLSHELRTPMNAILGFSELLDLEVLGPLGDGRYKGYTTSIHRSGQHLLQLVDEILEYSDAETGALTLHREPVALDRLVAEIVDAAEDRLTRAGVALSVDVAPSLPPADGDPERLRHALGQLVANAIRFTGRGGSVSIAADSVRDGLVLRISDTGIGMTADEIDQALQPFSRLNSALTRNEPGIGLGLPIAGRLVELHGGRLVIDSEKGKGTIVTISLPRRDLAPAAGGDIASSPETVGAAVGRLASGAPGASD